MHQQTQHLFRSKLHLKCLLSPLRNILGLHHFFHVPQLFVCFKQLCRIQWYAVKITHRKALYVRTHIRSCRPYTLKTPVSIKGKHIILHTYNTSEPWASQLAVISMVKASHTSAKNWLKLLPTFQPEYYGLLQGEDASISALQSILVKMWARISAHF